MAKKRESGRGSSSNERAKTTANGSSNLNLHTFEDVADSEDEFHVNRDKILLEEGPAQKRQRRMREEGEYA